MLDVATRRTGQPARSFVYGFVCGSGQDALSQVLHRLLGILARHSVRVNAESYLRVLVPQ